MRLVTQSGDRITAEFTAEELRVLLQALNEVCNGDPIPDWEFQMRIGVTRAKARALLEEALRLDRGSEQSS